jgi:hypothetical protein
MKKFLLSLTVLCLAFQLKANEGYREAMQQNLQVLDTTHSVNEMLALSNMFERIGEGEKTQWLPYYYAAYTCVMANYSGLEVSRKEEVLARAGSMLDKALSLKPTESELICLKAFQEMALLQIDPMQRGMKYMGEIYALLAQAQQLNSENPRVYYLKGLMLLNTPSQFGGDPVKAKQLLALALEKFNVQKVNEFYPVWGKAHCQQMLSK